MEFIYFVLAIIFLVLWLGKKPVAKSGDAIDYQGKTYAQGYWDGYRAHQNGVSTAAANDVLVGANSNIPQSAAAPEKVILDNQQEVVVTQAFNTVEQPTISSSEQKEKHDLQNINTALYIASFLLVAAAALFIGASLPESIKFMGVWLITTVFYVVGLILYKVVDKLRPAAVAFVGTGLALLPFTGVAMYNFMLHDTALCWFITSVIGLVAFVIAAMQLKNQVVSYLAIAFGVSLATSSVAVLHVGLIWYFVASIIFGSLMTILAKVQPKSNWIPASFARPIQETNNWIVPLTITASLFATNGLTTRDYWIISLISAFYYGAVAASSIEGRDVALFITRFLFSMAALLMAYDFVNTWTAVGLTMSVVGILQLAVSVIFLPKHTAGDSNNETWLWLGFAMQLAAPLFVLGNTSWAILVTEQLMALLLLSFGLSYSLRRIVLSIFGTIALAVLPILICTKVIEPRLDDNWISLIFILFAAIVLLVRYVNKRITDSLSVRPYMIANFGLFFIEALSFTFSVSNSWGFALWSIATILIYCLMFLERQMWLSIFANIMILTLITRFVVPTLELHWVAFIFIILATVSIVILSIEKLIKTSLPIRYYLVANIGLFIIEALAYTCNIEAGWGLAIWSTATVLVYFLMYLERQPWLSILANAMIWISITRFVEPTLDLHWVAFIFMAFALVTLAILSIEKRIVTGLLIRPCLIANFALFTVQSIALTFNMNDWWGFAFWSIATLAIYTLTFLERQPWLSIAANIMLLVSTVRLLDLLNTSYDWRPLIISWVAFIAFYGLYLILEALSKKQYSIYFWWSAVVVTVVINVFNLMSYIDHIAIAASLGLVVASIAIAIGGWRFYKLLYIDAGAILATVGLQRILHVIAPDTNLLVYTHWWAAVAASLSYLYYSFGMRLEAKGRIIIALSFVTFFTGMSALGAFGSSDIPYRTIFLVEHILILVSGLVLSRKLFATWGAVGAVLAVLWMIKGYTYLLLASVAFVLIGIAIYALVRQSKNASQ